MFRPSILLRQDRTRSRLRVISAPVESRSSEYPVAQTDTLSRCFFSKLHLRYFFCALIMGVIQFPVMAWFFAPYNSVGIAEYLPHKTFITGLIGIFIIVASGAWFKIVSPRPPTASAPLDRRTFRLLSVASFLTTMISAARLTFPLIFHNLSIFGRKLSPLEYAVWGSILLISSTLLKVLPAFVRNVVPTADEILASDSRRPVLYFRSFEKELSKTAMRDIFSHSLDKFRSPSSVYLFSTSPGNISYGGRRFARSMLRSNRSGFDEQMAFADALSAVGPYIALGRASETFRDMDLGAAKKYVSNAEWQNEVIHWLSNCAAVVLEAADSASLRWEIAQVVRLIVPTKVLLICPYRDDDYQSFLRANGHLFPRRLPDIRPESRLFIFNNNWWSHELENVNLNVTETLEPFFEQLRTGIAT
jgi:hypothetical protein